MRDNWCIGFSDRYTVAVWVGNFEGDSMHDVSGVTGAAPAWREIIGALHQNVRRSLLRHPAAWLPRRRHSNRQSKRIDASGSWRENSQRRQ